MVGRILAGTKLRWIAGLLSVMAVTAGLAVTGSTSFAQTTPPDCSTAASPAGQGVIDSTWSVGSWAGTHVVSCTAAGSFPTRYTVTVTGAYGGLVFAKDPVPAADRTVSFRVRSLGTPGCYTPT